MASNNTDDQPRTKLGAAGAAAVDTQPEGAPPPGAAQSVALGVRMDPNPSNGGEGGMRRIRHTLPLVPLDKLDALDADLQSCRLWHPSDAPPMNILDMGDEFSSLCRGMSSLDTSDGKLSQSERLMTPTRGMEDLRFMERPSLNVLHPWHPDVLMDRTNKLLSSGYVDSADFWYTLCVCVCVCGLRLSLWLWM